MAENLDTARFSAIFISAIEMGHENTKNLKSIYKTDRLFLDKTAWP